MPKYLSGLEVMQSGKDYRWMNWYINRKRFELPFNQDAVLRKDMRMVSHRRVL